MKNVKMYLLLGIIVLALFPFSWELGLYSILTIGTVFLIAFTAEAENADGTPDTETAKKVKRFAVIIISVFLTYRIFLLLLEFWFLPIFYKYWTKDCMNMFWATHLLIGGALISSMYLKKYATDTKAVTWVPFMLNFFSLLITINVVAHYGYKRFGDEVARIILPNGNTSSYSWDMSEGEVREFTVESWQKMKIKNQEFPVYIITANKDTVIREPRKIERFLYQSSATSDVDHCGSGVWKLLSKKEQRVELEVY